MEPKIADNLTAIWIGGGVYPSGGSEYNLGNDIAAANVVFKSNIPFWQVPRNVYQLVIVTLAELERRVLPCGKLGRYLFEQLEAWGHTIWANKPPRTGECWCLGDSPAVGLMLYDHPYRFDWIPAPEISQEMTYIHGKKNRPIRVYNYIDSRFILEDFYAKLALFTDVQ
jgi:purine nucleosidase